MNRGFYSSTLFAFISLSIATLVVILVFSVALLRSQAIDETQARLRAAHQVTAELLHVHDQVLAETALGLSRDPTLQQLFRSNSEGGLTRVLEKHRAVGAARELLLLDRAGRVRAATSRLVFDVGLDSRSISAKSAINVIVDGKLLRIAFAPLVLGEETLWLGAASPVGNELLSAVHRTTGVDVSLEVDGKRIATTQVGEAAGRLQRLRVQFMPESQLDVDVLFSVSNEVAFRQYREFILKLAALIFALTAAVIFCSAFVLGRIRNRFINAPISAMRSAVDRIRQGVYTEDLEVVSDDAIGRLGRAFNLMQSEIAERESRIVHHAEYDSLTGLTNRGVVDERLRAAFGRAQRTGATLAAMIIDLERFGDINGTMGNETGDAVLKEVARRLASNTRATDLLARVGGDEFLVVVEDMEAKLAEHISAFIVDTLQKPIMIGERAVNLRVHVGVALYPSHCDTPEGMRRLANVALATAKQTRQAVVVYEPGLDEQQLRELAILNDLPTALKQGQFELHYQPKLDIKTRTMETVEALVRWTHPQLGRVRPDEFIGLLEKHNKTQALTNWILKAAIEQVRDWEARGYEIGVAVNLSANDLHDKGLPGRIETMLRHYLVDPTRISVEVTESAVMRDPDQAREILQQLRDIGVRIAIDDFGTGQTSLSLLKQLPLNELKIDQSFVRELRTNSGDAIIVKSTIDLGHNMGLLVVAEGVESTYAWNLLKSYRCDIVQGYLVSKPLPASQLESWYLRLQARQASRLDFSFLNKQPEAADAEGNDGGSADSGKSASHGEPQTIIDILDG